ncbi:uncharacterized protein LOC143187020 isoform X2 [Calliopsis andreniformis]|uniref:uncharacterized protein LOC143187020 isoform X2 n=1 Tax=Calliopsis andreniformis TaxID=337506 RepID=UPI003FCC5FCF
MKYQQISVDFACFWLPGHLKKQNDVQRMLQDKVENYEKYILQCEERERSEQEMRGEDVKVDPTYAEKWKERRECLEMLKKELSKVRDSGDNSHDWDYLLEEEETQEKDSTVTEIQDTEISRDKEMNDLEYKKDK